MECVWMVRLIADCNKMHHCMRHLLALYTIIWISNWSFEQLVLVYMLFKIVCIYFSISNPPLSVWGHPKQKLIMTSMHPKQKLNKKLQYFFALSAQYFLPWLERTYVQNKDTLLFLAMRTHKDKTAYAASKDHIYFTLPINLKTLLNI